jgi:hypothetical protein
MTTNVRVQLFRLFWRSPKDHLGAPNNHGDDKNPRKIKSYRQQKPAGTHADTARGAALHFRQGARREKEKGPDRAEPVSDLKRGTNDGGIVIAHCDNRVTLPLEG